jgi:drug/metabolite transporter (DMT)-like permease
MRYHEEINNNNKAMKGKTINTSFFGSPVFMVLILLLLSFFPLLLSFFQFLDPHTKNKKSFLALFTVGLVMAAMTKVTYGWRQIPEISFFRMLYISSNLNSGDR